MNLNQSPSMPQPPQSAQVKTERPKISPVKQAALNFISRRNVNVNKQRLERIFRNNDF
jgi:hypothetical protein